MYSSFLLKNINYMVLFQISKRWDSYVYVKKVPCSMYFINNIFIRLGGDKRLLKKGVEGNLSKIMFLMSML